MAFLSAITCRAASAAPTATAAHAPTAEATDDCASTLILIIEHSFARVYEWTVYIIRLR